MMNESTASVGIRIRPLLPGEEPEACALVRAVFQEFVAPGMAPEGVAEFLRFAAPEAMAARWGSGQVLLGAEQDGRLVGVAEVRDGSHLALLFVTLRRHGVARALFEAVTEACRARDPGLQALTVNSSLYAEPVYRRLGFLRTAEPCTIHGIPHVPMALSLP